MVTGNSSESTADSSVGRLLRQLGDDVGSDSTSGKTLKASGTVVEAYREWQLSLASNSNLADVVWQVGRVAWKPPIAPTVAEMLVFREKIATMLEVDNDKRGNIFSRITFRSRPQPLVLMRLLSDQNMEAGPWLATLVAAVHAGASSAVRSWALQSLTTTGAQGAVDLGLEQEAVFVLLRQASKAVDALVADLQAVATNKYWRSVPRAILSELSETLPALPHRNVAADWWRDVTDHYDQYELPVYRLGQHLSKGIQVEGARISDSAGQYSVMTVEDFCDLVSLDFVGPLEMRTISDNNNAILTRVNDILQYSGTTSLQDALVTGLKIIKSLLVPGSRIVALDMAQNMAGLARIGLGSQEREDRNSMIRSLCLCVSGTIIEVSTSDIIVCIQTAVGLFIPCLPNKCLVDAPVKWHLQALRLDQLRDNSILTYGESTDLACNNLFAGLGPMTNRPMSSEDTIRGVVIVNSQVLEALCLVRGELTVVNFSRILARLLVLECAYCAEDGPVCSRVADDTELLTFTYLTPDLILKSIKRAEVSMGDGEHRLLILAGDNVGWQILSLAITPGTAIYQNLACTNCSIRLANKAGASVIIAGTVGDNSITSTPP